MNGNVQAIQSEIERLQKSIIKMEFKERRLFEEYKGNPPPETILEYDRIMEVYAVERERLKKQLEGIYPVTASDSPNTHPKDLKPFLFHG